ncbi:MAG: RecQ family ATP-dependent DNA helicase [Gammaproteobacteria bacterium]
MNGSRTDRESARDLLRKAVGSKVADFRDGQWEAINVLVNDRKKLLVVQRTGWGKSSVYFVATRIFRDGGAGPTLIISPLLALMRNQMDAAKRLGIRALSINSTNREQWPDLIARIREDEVDALLISPERLANDAFVADVMLPVANRIGLVVVDEAHCISDWGHDFRPDYRRLLSVLQHMPPNMPVLGTTATANNRVLDDIRMQLGDIQVQRGPLMRESVALQTMRVPDQSARLAWLAELVPGLPGTGIIYTLTVRDAEQVAEWLNRNGIEARAYYADAKDSNFPDSNTYRQHLEDRLLNNRIKALVATTALGMGYDKPDLGFVVHYQAPGSIVAYYQQVGRAGRAIDRAVGVLLAGREDEDIQQYFRAVAFPAEGHVSAILDALAESDGLTARQIEEAVNLRAGQIEKVLKFLSIDSPAPIIKDGSKWRRTAVSYRMDHARIERLTQQRIVEWQEVQSYINTQECLMTFLARALDDREARPCGKCANCLGHPVVGVDYAHAGAVAAARYLKHAELALVCKKQVAANAFKEYGFRGNLPERIQAESGRILSRWGDAGWGQVVRDDKHAGHFRDELAEALAEMIRDRWRPAPVPDLAQRVARSLKLSFVAAVVKVRTNEPQKLQQNRYHQCVNLDGVFKVTDDVLDGPVLLVDDVVDSAWTMTVVAALLRRSGAGLVWPVALASTSAGD